MNDAYSVVIPAFNAAATLRSTIDSILAQTVAAREIIVVDDGSIDETASVAGAIAGPITLIRQANRGPGAATTAGFSRVTTQWVATLDADDLWLPHKIERQFAFYADNTNLAGIFSLARLFNDGEKPDPQGIGAVRRLWTRTTMLFRTQAAREIGDFTDFPGQLGEVIDWLARSRDLGHRHAMIDEILAMRRIRPGSLSSGLDADRSRGYLVAVRNAIERKRQMAEKGKTGPAS
jgi:glycosyltransferase involved in cell wall biosynthesis